MHRTVKSLAVIIVVLLAVALATGYLYTRQSVVVPHIVAGAEQSTPIMATHTFSFEKSRITISVPVSAAVYNGAKVDRQVSLDLRERLGEYLGDRQLPCDGQRFRTGSDVR